MFAGAHGQIPHYGYLPPSTNQDVLPLGPASAPTPIPESLAMLRPEILAIHTSQQANRQARANQNQRTQARNVRRVELLRGNLQQQGVLPARPQDEYPPPPSPYRQGETSLDRQRRTRPQAPRITIFDGDFRQCATCLEFFRYVDKLWRLQCGHTFHVDCWDRAARTQVE